MSEVAPQQHAFSAQLAARLPSKLACVEAWRRSVAEGDRLLAGLQDGTLMILAPRDGSGASTPRTSGDAPSGGQPAASDSKNGGGAWRIAQAFRSWGGNRSISQLEVSPGRGLLLSLGDQGVSVHRLPAFKLSCQASRTR